MTEKHTELPTSDRELLELAAKAAGITKYIYCELVGNEPALYCKEIHLGIWAPLIDDGDALRLAVQVGACIDRSRTKSFVTVMIEASGEHDGASATERVDGDAYAATRRAIVRAAAEIAKAKGETK